MDNQIKITQRKFGRRLVFDFLPDHLVCLMRDQGAEHQFPVPYETIDVLAPPGMIVAPNAGFLRKLVLIPLAIGAISIILQGYAPAASGPVLTIALVLLVLVWLGRFFRIFAVKYTSMAISPSPPGTSRKAIVVMTGKDHDRIVDEIKKRWKARLRELHGSINLSADPAKEVVKFNWLKDHGVISDEECQQALRKLQTLVVEAAQLKSAVQEPEQRTLN